MITSYPRQGVCGDEAGSAVVCGPTQVKSKKVKMMFKVYNMVFFLDLIKSFQDIIMKKTSMIIARSLIFQTNSSGQSYKDSKTRLKEMILDEHTEVSGRVVIMDCDD